MALPPLDQLNTVVDIGAFARSGLNTVVVQIATTLYNKVVHEGKVYGILGTRGAVSVTPYRILPLRHRRKPEG